MLKERLIFIGLSLLCLSACNSNDSAATSVTLPGHQSVQVGGEDLTTQCDDLRKRGRHEAFQALGIDMLEEGSDQILSKMSPADYREIEGYATSGTPESSQQIDKIIAAATQAAKLNWSTLQLGPETHRKLLLGNADYLDKQGDFSVGSTTAIDENSLKSGDVYNVYLVVGPDTFSQYDIKIEVVLGLVTETVSMLQYVNSALLPSMCNGVSSNLDESNFNSIPVNAQN